MSMGFTSLFASLFAIVFGYLIDQRRLSTTSNSTLAPSTS